MAGKKTNDIKIQVAYWKMVLEAFKKSSCNLYDNVSPTPKQFQKHYLKTKNNAGVHYAIALKQQGIHIDLVFDSSKASKNKFLFDFFLKLKDEIEGKFSHRLEWLRLDDKKRSKIQYAYQIDTTNESNWKECVNWHITHMTKLENATKDVLKEAMNH